ncbi:MULTISPECIES: FeoA family protein [unclassified Sphingomonas]|jgi:ferrous iron transport protein A|uniref:FeoA family protein n=1 Tax=unclassified Sphingomonas TaxID=196159 RepID=UPI0006F97874|nr:MULTISPECIES: FeoA family protein [unclassified Sphingomonas]KQM26589.1 iron transporter FeoA [Sphingomonas sp. Leaf9]KQM42995.1 iron transporter FeoA [Sphingomonas sp. Leaf11]KQM87035.1 iron transporter FeoA [Sphingomonas sp. Leaf23]
MLSPNLHLTQLPRTCRATVASVDWEGMSPGEARRLREFGLDEGVDIELLHRAMLSGGPLACRIGRMTVALRAHVAGAIRVAPLAS